jgi:cathepsin H
LLAARFDAWASAHKKAYKTPEERLARLRNFADTTRRVSAHNSRGDSTYALGLNAFADWTDAEFSSYYNLGDMKGQQECSATSNVAATPVQKIQYASPPARMDWRESGVVSPVKNQGHCGSCWTFSSTGALEAHYKKATGQDVSLSEQQLVDCAFNYDNHGCSGGLPSHAFQYVLETGGIDTEKTYPYKAADGDRCKFRKWAVGAKVTGVVNITQFDEKQLEAAVGSAGPVSVAFQVASDFRMYASGVYQSAVCGNLPKDVNHAVLAVGYDTDKDGVKYWIIKNSWGAQWGMQGYFYMLRGKNMCGVSDCASYPVVA